MKLGVAKKGMEVVVNSNEDATIFRITNVSEDGWLVDLVYDVNGKECYGGLIDVGMIKLPTQVQLTNKQK